MTETIFDLSITLGNDAMQTPADVARALRATADTLDRDDWYDTTAGIRDANGSTVGAWKVDAYTRD